jgi:protein-S-isoprenylcysteine O-methyltransferase Ste14
MKLTALVLFVVWVVLAFGWRSVVQLRRTGDSGLRLHAEPATAQWWAKVGFVLAILLGFAAPIAAVAGLDNVAALETGWVQMVGLVLTLAGIALTVLAQHSLGASWRIGVDPTEETALVTHGAFRWVRNPIFTAMLITAIGFVLLIPNSISMLAVFALFVSVEMQVRLVEEPYLLNIQGSNYATYAAHVGRFVPSLGRLHDQIASTSAADRTFR